MQRLRHYYDRRARNISRNWAILFTVNYAVILCIGIAKLTTYFGGDDASVHLYAGLIMAILGLIGIPHGIQTIRAVVRRIKSQPRASILLPH